MSGTFHRKFVVRCGVVALSVAMTAMASVMAQDAAEAPEEITPILSPDNLGPIRQIVAEQNAYEDGLLNRYEWIDEDAGTVRIPIERAMKLTVERGLLPHRAVESAPESPETSESPEASSAPEAAAEEAAEVAPSH